MYWEAIRRQYPGKWLLLEALSARSTEGKRIVEQLSVIDDFIDSAAALQDYAKLHRSAPERELYVFHTSRKDLNIGEQHWLGIRGKA